uniref:Putative secreted protein n=1 Tax=Ixodes ricinus TaxID=34613 RepID=A0A6B0UHK4_IXORI
MLVIYGILIFWLHAFWATQSVTKFVLPARGKKMVGPMGVFATRAPNALEQIIAALSYPIEGRTRSSAPHFVDSEHQWQRKKQSLSLSLSLSDCTTQYSRDDPLIP